MNSATNASDATPKGTILSGNVARVAPALAAYTTDRLFGTVWTDDTLSARERAAS